MRIEVPLCLYECLLYRRMIEQEQVSLDFEVWYHWPGIPIRYCHLKGFLSHQSWTKLNPIDRCSLTNDVYFFLYGNEKLKAHFKYVFIWSLKMKWNFLFYALFPFTCIFTFIITLFEYNILNSLLRPNNIYIFCKKRF